MLVAVPNVILEKIAAEAERFIQEHPESEPEREDMKKLLLDTFIETGIIGTLIPRQPQDEDGGKDE